MVCGGFDGLRSRRASSGNHQHLEAKVSDAPSLPTGGRSMRKTIEEKESFGAYQFQFVPSRDTEEENCGENKQLESDCLDAVGRLHRC